MNERDLKPDNVPHPALEVACPTCCAKPGERCGNLLDARKYRDVPHARRIESLKERS